MRKLLCLMLAVIMIASTAVIAVNAEDSGKAVVTLKNMQGDTVTETYAVGETFTAYTYLNASEINEGRIGSLDAEQTYDEAILEVADEYDKDPTSFDKGAVEDLEAMFPNLPSSTFANAGVSGSIFYNASVASTKGFQLASDDTELIVVHYTVIAAGNATINNKFRTLASSTSDLTRIVDDYTIVNPNFTMPIALSAPAAPAGFTVSGKVNSFETSNTASDEITLTLTGSDVNYTDTVTVTADGYDNKKSNITDFAFEDVPEGTYVLSVSKENHVTREYDVTVNSETEALDVKICPKGDANLNGRVQSNDAMAVYKHAQASDPANMITDPYALKCADVKGTNGRVQSNDAMEIYKQAQGQHSLF